MITASFGRALLGIGLAVALLAGCNGSQQAGVPGAMPQNVASGAHVTHGGSWMKPGASGGDLVYVTSPSTGDVYVLSYPGGVLVGTLTGFLGPTGACSDANGNVWIINDSGGSSASLIEYAHGGTSPIATLSDANQVPYDCAVDSTTGNLAVVNRYENVAIYLGARGTPVLYSTKPVKIPETTTYDSSGDLFVEQTYNPGKLQATAWLQKGGSTFQPFALKPHRSTGYGALRWDGQYLANGILVHKADVKRYAIIGNYAEVVGSVQLNNYDVGRPFWIQGSGLTAVCGQYASVCFYNYPAGGNPTKTITGLVSPYAVTVSVAPPGSHSRK
jgi:hypothetical protein